MKQGAVKQGTREQGNRGAGDQGTEEQGNRGAGGREERKERKKNDMDKFSLTSS